MSGREGGKEGRREEGGRVQYTVKCVCVST